VLSKIHTQLSNYAQAIDGLSTALTDFKVSVLKMKNLADIVAQNGVQQVQDRVNILKLSKSVANMILIDENESFDQRVTALSGVPDTARMIADRLVTASKIPHTILFGESPSGLAATGRAEESAWFNSVKGYQESNLRPAIMEFLRASFRAKNGPTRGKEHEKYTVEFYPLWQLDEKEEVEKRKIQSEVDRTYMEFGVIDPEEVRKSRFEGEQYTIETRVEDRASLPTFNQ
jgi:uncharacterized protein